MFLNINHQSTQMQSAWVRSQEINRILAKPLQTITEPQRAAEEEITGWL